MAGKTKAKCYVGDPFRWDVFVSYAHNDFDRTGDSDFVHWARLFHAELRKAIRSVSDDFRLFDSYFDDRLGTGSDVDATLQAEAQAAAFLVALVSPYYMTADYCTRERGWWQDSALQSRFSARDRLLPVVIWKRTPTDIETWEQALSTIGAGNPKHHVFFDQSVDRDLPFPFGWPGRPGLVPERSFFDALFALLNDLVPSLQKFRELVADRQALERAEEPRSPDDPTTVYLHATDANADAFDHAFAALSRRGFVVTPDAPEPVEPSLARRNALSEARTARLQDSNALLVIAHPDNPDLNQEIKAWNHYHGLPIGLSEQTGNRSTRRLPRAVLDPIVDARRAGRRQMTAEKFQWSWFHLPEPDWVDRAAAWIAGKS